MLTPAEIEALRLSLQVATTAVAFSLPMAVAVAWLLARKRFPGRALVDAVVHLPLVLPPVVIGYFLLVLFGTQGPIGGWLNDMFGLRLIFTRWGAALAAAVMSFPLMVRAIRLALEAVDRGLEDAARTLGASRLDVFFSVTLPLMLPGILSGASSPSPRRWGTSARPSPSSATCRARRRHCRSPSTASLRRPTATPPRCGWC
jgi:molybdate transport system permease protein